MWTRARIRQKLCNLQNYILVKSADCRLNAKSNNDDESEWDSEPTDKFFVLFNISIIDFIIIFCQKRRKVVGELQQWEWERTLAGAAALHTVSAQLKFHQNLRILLRRISDAFLQEGNEIISVFNDNIVSVDGVK